MRIFLDGCDGTGKTTLAKYLSERFNLDIFCLTKEGVKSVKRYKELLSIDNVVHDRTFLSEVVYPPVFGRSRWLSDDVICELIDQYRKSDDIFVICTCDDRAIRERISHRFTFEYEEVVDNINYINGSYKEIAIKYDLLLVDTYKLTLEEIGDIIEKEIKKW